MDSTNTSATVTGSLAEDLTDQLLQARRIYLKRKQARLPYVVDARKKLAARIATPFRILLAVSLADLDDGLSVALAVAPYEALIALLREHAARRRPTSALPFVVRFASLMRRQASTQAKLEIAQIRVLADPSDVAARRDVRRALSEYGAAFEEMRALVSEDASRQSLAVA